MASAPTCLAIQRKRLPLAGAYFTPVKLSGLGLIHAVESIGSDVVSAVRPSIPFQKRNIRTLIVKVKLFLSFFESLKEQFPPSPTFRLSSSANLCFKELYIVLYRCKILLDYCNDSSRLWLLLQNRQVSAYFHDLKLEISTLLDVLSIDEFALSTDAREQTELLRKQARRSKQYIDPRDEKLRLKIHSFLDDLENERLPDEAKLRATFVDQLEIRDADTCRMEIEFLEEQIYDQEEDDDFSVLNGLISLTRYCRFLLFGFGREAGRRRNGSCDGKKWRWIKAAVCEGVGDAFLTAPKEFFCPISLELIRDPVILSTGQTYERDSISRWFDEGHKTCPNSGQTLTDVSLVPNRALQSVIALRCAAHGVAYDPPVQSSDESKKTSAVTIMCKAALEANRATANILVQQLSVGPEDLKGVAAHELRLLAKMGNQNRFCIAEAGAIPFLRQLLLSSDPFAQENSVTAILNLSILEVNKSRIVEQEGCLRPIVDVLRHGLTAEARENAAAALFSLSLVREYKKLITDEEGAVESLAGLLRDGTLRGKKDAVMALYNLSTHAENCRRMMESGLASALADATGTEYVAEEASGALALLVRRQFAAEAIAEEDNIVTRLVGLMKQGTPKSKENAVAALVEMCRIGGAGVTEKVARAPALCGLIQSLLFTGTKRARRKAASLAKLFQRHEASRSTPFGGRALRYALDRSRVMGEGANFDGSSDVSVSVPVSVSVRVL